LVIRRDEMGPLVPEVIGNELNFVVALFIGIAFGFILEQAGFSTSKKLVGMFYGYDFTVLRVFFTGGVTAMIGVIAFAHFGLLDVSLIYINPTFLWSAIIGGLIMGLGFVIGGYCPGTSFCGAAIGKIDAMIFVVGSFIGVLIFGEGYPLFENLYKAASWGNITIFNVFGMSQSLFAFLLIFIAVGAFWATTLIENKVNGKPNPEFSSKPLYFGLTAIAIVIGLSAFIMPDKKDAMLHEVSDINYVKSFPIESVTADELAFRLIDEEENLKIFDLRSPKEYALLSLPKSTNVTLQSMFEKDVIKQLSMKHSINVFIADNELEEKKAAIVASELGSKRIEILKGGFAQFQTDILNFKMPEKVSGRHDIDTYKFRIEAAGALPIMIKEYKEKLNKSNVKTEKKRVLGGC
jgi:rhodanese-related sulfurtransferase